MIPLQPWFERSFPFDLPLSRFAPTLERLRGTPARLEERLAGAPPARLTRKPAAGWSAQEHAGHLLDLEALWAGRLDDFAANAEMLRPADLSNAATDQANHNAHELAELLAAFRAARGELVARLERLDEAGAGRTALHPRLQQPMRVLDLAYFVAEHDDHHLAAITALLAEA